jgi:hypothetical protein
MYWGVWVAKKSTCGNHPTLTTPKLFWTASKPQALVRAERCEIVAKQTVRSLAFPARASTHPPIFASPPPLPKVEKLLTGLKIVVFPVVNRVMTLASSATSRLTGVSIEDLSNNAHAKKIEAFYASQASAYDAFRENFLHARKSLATCLPLKPGK